MHTKEEKLEALGRLLDIMDDLREQCPWDRKQTLQSLRQNTLEEAYELSDAVLKEDLGELKKELGDVLLHIVFYSKIGEEKNAFDIADVAHAISEKLIFRHPHIYGDVKVKDEQEVKRNWEKLKLKEKGNQSVLGGVPQSLPSIIKAYRIQEKVKGVGFDFPTKDVAWAKVEEELREFQIENDSDKKELELGDLLFSIINYARISGLNPDTALSRTNEKFIRRFQKLEGLAMNQNKKITELSLSEMDGLWEAAKRAER